MTFIKLSERQDMEDIRQLLLTTFETSAEADLVDKLRGASYYDRELSFVAIHNYQIVGYALFTRIVIKDGNRTFPALLVATCAVLPEFQNQGIGSLLMTEGLKKCKYFGCKIVLSSNAPKFFNRFGFEPTINHQIDPPDGIDDQSFLGYLTTSSLGAVKGSVHYPIEFVS